MIRLGADMGIFQSLSESKQPLSDSGIAKETGADPALVCKKEFVVTVLHSLPDIGFDASPFPLHPLTGAR